MNLELIIGYFPLGLIPIYYFIRLWMLVDSHFESNEDARRLAHWEEIIDFGLT